MIVGSNASLLAGGMAAIKHTATARGKSARATRLQNAFQSGCCMMGNRPTGAGRLLSTIFLDTADQHGTPMPVEPGLNSVADMGRAIFVFSS